MSPFIAFVTRLVPVWALSSYGQSSDHTWSTVHNQVRLHCSDCPCLLFITLDHPHRGIRFPSQYKCCCCHTALAYLCDSCVQGSNCSFSDIVLMRMPTMILSRIISLWRLPVLHKHGEGSDECVNKFALLLFSLVKFSSLKDHITPLHEVTLKLALDYCVALTVILR